MSFDDPIRKGVKWLLTGSLGNQALGFFIGIVLARLLFPADFGMIATIQVFTGFVGMITAGGMGQALIRAKTAGDRDFHVVFTVQLLIGGIVFLSFFIIAPYFAEWFNDPLYRDLLRTSALTFLLRPFANIHRFWLQREMRFRGQSLAALATNFITGATSIGMAFTGFGVWSLVLSGILGSLLNIVFLSSLTPLRIKTALDPGVVRTLGSYGIKVTLNDLLVYLAERTPNLIISRISGPAMVGLYNKGESQALMPFNIISNSVYQPVFRTMSKSQDDLDTTKYLFYRMISLLVVYTLPFYIGLSWLAEPFIATLYGEKWLEAAVPLQIIVFVGALLCIGHPCGAVLAAQNRLGREMVVQAIRWMLIASAAYIGLDWGLAAVAWGIVIGNAVSTTLLFVLAKQCFKTGIKDLVQAVAPGLTLNAILLAVLLLFDALLPDRFIDDHQTLYLLSTAAVGVLAYAGAFLFLPLPSLASETRRWKSLLGLTRI